LAENHLARFVVDIVEQLDVRHLSSVYAGKGSRPYHPTMMLALLFCGYASGTFSSCRLEQSTYDSINAFRKRFLKELKGLFVDILVIAKTMGTLKLGTISLDGTKIKASASKHKALSWKYANQLESQLKKEVEELMRLAEQSDNSDPVESMKYRLRTPEGRALYGKRKSTIEPTFGIVKHVLGFRQFLLRGLDVVNGKWDLVCIGYNMKRMFELNA
jgi:transposase